jgi:hypothetical protein
VPKPKKMWAIQDKKSGQLLVCDLEVEEYGDYGGWEITWQTYKKAVLTIRKGSYGGTVFVTTDETIIDALLRPRDPKKSSYVEDTYRLSVPQSELADLVKVKVHVT